MSVFSPFYVHSMDVYRSAVEKNDGISCESRQLIYENVPVRASAMTGFSSSRFGTIPSLSEEIGANVRRYALFHSTDIVVKAGDIVRLTRDGVEIWGRAWDSLVYENHTETLIEENKAA